MLLLGICNLLFYAYEITIPSARFSTQFTFDYVFKRNGKPLTHSGLTRTWWNIKREMQITAGTKMVRNQLIPPFKIDDKVIAYCCRHSFATELKDAQMPFTIMQELLGHSTGTITDVYLHSTEKSLDLARRLLAEHRNGNVKIKLTKIQ